MYRPNQVDPENFESRPRRTSIDYLVQDSYVSDQNSIRRVKSYTQHVSRFDNDGHHTRDQREIQIKFFNVDEKMAPRITSESSLGMLGLESKKYELPTNSKNRDVVKKPSKNGVLSLSGSRERLDLIGKNVKLVDKTMIEGSENNTHLSEREMQNKNFERQIKGLEGTIQIMNKGFPEFLIDGNTSFSNPNIEGAQLYGIQLNTGLHKNLTQEKSIGSSINNGRSTYTAQHLDEQSRHLFTNDFKINDEIQDFNKFDVKNTLAYNENPESKHQSDNISIISNKSKQADRLQDQNSVFNKKIDINDKKMHEISTKDTHRDVFPSNEMSVQQKISMAYDQIQILEKGKKDDQEILEKQMKLITDLENKLNLSNYRVKFLEDSKVEIEKRTQLAFKKESDDLKRMLEDQANQIRNLKFELVKKEPRLDSPNEDLKLNGNLDNENKNNEYDDLSSFNKDKYSTISELQRALLGKDELIASLKATIQQNQTPKHSNSENEFNYLLNQLKEKTNHVNTLTIKNKNLEEEVQLAKESLENRAVFFNENKKLMKENFALKQSITDQFQVIESLKQRLSLNEDEFVKQNALIRQNKLADYEKFQNEINLLHGELQSKEDFIYELTCQLEEQDKPKNIRKQDQAPIILPNFDNEKVILKDTLEQKNRLINELSEGISLIHIELENLKKRFGEERSAMVRIFQKEFDQLKKEGQDKSKMINDLRRNASSKDKQILILTDELLAAQKNNDIPEIDNVNALPMPKYNKTQALPQFSNFNDNLNYYEYFQMNADSHFNKNQSKFDQSARSERDKGLGKDGSHNNEMLINRPHSVYNRNDYNDQDFNYRNQTLGSAPIHRFARKDPSNDFIDNENQQQFEKLKRNVANQPYVATPTRESYENVQDVSHDDRSDLRLRNKLHNKSANPDSQFETKVYPEVNSTNLLIQNIDAQQLNGQKAVSHRWANSKKPEYIRPTVTFNDQQVTELPEKQELVNIDGLVENSNQIDNLQNDFKPSAMIQVQSAFSKKSLRDPLRNDTRQTYNQNISTVTNENNQINTNSVINVVNEYNNDNTTNEVFEEDMIINIVPKKQKLVVHAAFNDQSEPTPLNTQPDQLKPSDPVPVTHPTDSLTKQNSSPLQDQPIKNSNVSLENNMEIKTTDGISVKASDKPEVFVKASQKEISRESATISLNADALVRFEQIEKILANPPFNIVKLEDTPQKIVELQQEIEDYKNELQTKQNEIEKMIENFKLIENENTDYKGKQSIVMETKESMTGFFSELKSLKDHLIVLEDRIEALHAQNKELTEQNNNLKGNLIATNEKVKKGETLTDISSNSPNNESKTLSDKVRQLTFDLSMANDRVKILEYQNEKYRKEYLKYQDQEDIKRKNKNLERENEDLEHKIHTIKDTSSETMMKISELTISLKNEQSENDRLRKVVAAKISEIDTLENDLKKKGKENSELKEAMSHLKNELDNLRSGLENKLNLLVRETEKLVSHQEEINDKHKEEIKNLNKTIDKLNNRIEELVLNNKDDAELLKTKDSIINNINKQSLELQEQRKNDFLTMRHVLETTGIQFKGFEQATTETSIDMSMKKSLGTNIERENINYFTIQFEAIIQNFKEKLAEQEELIDQKDLEIQQLAKKAKKVAVMAQAPPPIEDPLPALNAKYENSVNQLKEAEVKMAEMAKQLDDNQNLQQEFFKLKGVTERLMDEMAEVKEQYYNALLVADSYQRQRETVIEEIEGAEMKCADYEKELDKKSAHIGKLTVKLFVLMTELERMNESTKISKSLQNPLTADYK